MEHVMCSVMIYEICYIEESQVQICIEPKHTDIITDARTHTYARMHARIHARTHARTQPRTRAHVRPTETKKTPVLHHFPPTTMAVSYTPTFSYRGKRREINSFSFSTNKLPNLKTVTLPCHLTLFLECFSSSLLLMKCQCPVHQEFKCPRFKEH